MGKDCKEQCLSHKEITIHTLEGDMIASKGDYIIKGVNGEFYPCKPDTFNKRMKKLCINCYTEINSNIHDNFKLSKWYNKQITKA